MNKKIIGITVGSPLPKSDFNQNDPTKGDYIKNRPDLSVYATTEYVDDAIDEIEILAPIARVIQTDSGASIYIRDKDGETKAVVTNGKDGYTPKYGVDYFDGKDGTSVTVKSAIESTEDGGSNVVTFSDGNTVTIKNGSKGSSGYTPVKGKDYFDGEPGDPGIDGITPHIGDNGNWYVGSTDTGKPSRGADGADGVSIESIKQTTTSATDGGLNVFTVTLDNGTSATFTVKNGSKGSTGATGSSGYTPVKGVDYFTDEDKAEWGAYIASELARYEQLTPEFADSIEECTDTTKMYVLPDGYIYAYMLTDVEVETGPAYTNVLPLAITANKTPYVGANGEKGYNSNFRVSSSGVEKSATNYYATGFIPVKAGDTVRIKGMNGSDGNEYCVAYYAADDMVIKSSISPTYTLLSLTADGNNVRTFSPTNSATAYMRLTFMGNPADIIITVNEEIVEGGGGTTTVTGYAWVSTGRAFVPADYEDRIVSLENQTAELRELINNGGNGNTENVLTYTNVIPSATMGSDQTTGWVEGKGYTQNARLSGSNGTVVTNYTVVEDVCVSGYIPVTEGDIVRIKGFYPPDGVNTYVVAYNGTTPVGHKTFEPVTNLDSGDGSWEWNDDTGGWYSIDKKEPLTEVTATIEMSSANFGSGFNAIRFSGVFSEEVIVTVNEELESGTGTGSGSSTDAEKLELIRNWDAPVYDANIPVFQLSAEKAAMTNAAMTPDDIYAKYDALMAKHPHYITKTDLGLCSDGVNHVYRYDFMEPDSRHTSGYQWSETKTKAIIVSGIHYEWAGIYGLYYALEEIAENPELFSFRRNSHLIVVPCMNPYATIAGNYNGTNGSQGVKNANGVEIHRNFEVGWTLTEAGTLHYGGAQPLSEVETQYVNTIMKENTDAALFLTCHSFGDEGFNFIWPSTATAYTCNVGYRLIDKLSNIWMDKYGDELVGLEDYRTDDIPSWDNRLGFAHISSTPGTETRQGTKYGIQSANVEINGRFWVHGTKANPEPSMSSFTMSRGAEVYVNFLLTYFGVYDPKDKTLYS